MYKSNMAENPDKQTAWKCRLDQYPPMILNPNIQYILGWVDIGFRLEVRLVFTGTPTTLKKGH